MTRRKLSGLSFLLLAALLALVIVPAACSARIASVSASTYWGGTAIDQNGSLWRWGYENGTASQYEPYIVPGITGVKAIDGNYYTLILKDDGTVWVMDTYPNLDADTELRIAQQDIVQRLNKGEVVRLENLSHVSAIACNSDKWIVLKDDGTVWTWNSTLMGVVKVDGLSDVKQIATGMFGNYAAVKSDGTVWTWGSDTIGVLGRGKVNTYNDNGVTWPAILTPSPVPGLTDVKEVAAGMYFVAALKNDGTVWTWGNNDNGELGGGKSGVIESVRPYPGQVTGLTDVVAIAATTGEGFALRKDGTVWNWGGREKINVPVMMDNLTGVVQISANDEYILALDQNGVIWGRGRDDCGQLGDGKHGPNYYVNEPVKAPFSELLSGPAIEPSWTSTVSPAPTQISQEQAPDLKDIVYLTPGDDGTIYAFTPTEVIAYDGAGNFRWNLTIPGQWMHDKIREEVILEIPGNGNVSGAVLARSTEATPAIATANGHLYMYVLRNVQDSDWHYIDHWIASFQGNARLPAEKAIIAISPEGKVEWEYSLTEDVGWFDRRYIEAKGDRIYFFHDYTETVLSHDGSVLFDIGNVSDPVTVTDDGTIYAFPAVRAYWDGLYRASSGEYADFRVPGTTLEAYDRNGNSIWSKDIGVSPVRQYFSAGVSDAFHSMPIYEDGKLYVPTDSGIAALDANGRILWSKPFGDSNYRLLNVMPADPQGNLYFRRDNGDATQTIRSIDSEGKDRSSFVYRAPSLSWLWGDNGTLYEATRIVVNKSSTTDLDTMRVGAIDARTGSYIWNYTMPIVSKATTCINRSNADTFFQYGINEAQMGPDPGPTVYGYAVADIAPAGNNVYVSLASVSYEYPIEFDRSRATYARALYALDRDGNLVWQHSLDSFGTAWAANNTTVFYAGDDGKINIAIVGLAAAGGIAIIVSAYLFLKYFLFGAVTRGKARPDDNANRKQIMQFIVASPGATQYEIARQTGINMGTVRYHLLILGMNHKVRTFKEGKFIRYFPNSNLFSPGEQLAISLLRREPIGGIIGALLESPGLTYADLTRRFGLSDVAVGDHMKTLYDRGVISREKTLDGRLMFRVTPDFAAIVDGLKARNIVIKPGFDLSSA